MGESYDLWEMFEGISLYSISSIYGAFKAMINIYLEVKDLYQDDVSKFEFITKQIEN